MEQEVPSFMEVRVNKYFIVLVLNSAALTLNGTSLLQMDTLILELLRADYKDGNWVALQLLKVVHLRVVWQVVWLGNPSPTRYLVVTRQTRCFQDRMIFQDVIPVSNCMVIYCYCCFC